MRDADVQCRRLYRSLRVSNSPTCQLERMDRRILINLKGNIMKYKGFIISPVYSICADWKLDKNNIVVPKKKTALFFRKSLPLKILGRLLAMFIGYIILQ